ncbi:MAG: thymidine phosphorylase [Paracoccaceae bacterium]
MLIQDLIRKKRDKKRLTSAEIKWFVQQLCNNEVEPAQAGAFLMASWINGLSELEKVNLTNAMMNSGTVLKWDLNGPIVDKHSTGGVGDTVSLILAPLMASLGCFVPMISGKGLGHTGGTLDKLSSIPGYKIEQSESAFQKIVSEVGCAIVGQTSQLVPADKIFYATRDVTSTVDSVDLITASIISKKLASGINNLILDVKVGRGALMKNITQAKKLAQSLVSVANASNCKTKALITKMDDPLSSSIGNSLEVETVVEVLLGKNKNEQALLDTTMALSIELYSMVCPEESHLEIKNKIYSLLDSGHVAERFENMVSALGGPNDFLTTYKRVLPKTQYVIPVKAKKEGYITRIDTKALGNILIKMGGGRQKASDNLNLSVGFTMVVKSNDKVDTKKALLMVHTADKFLSTSLKEEINNCFSISEREPGQSRNPILKKVI